MKRFEIEFRYSDELSKGKWHRQSCILAAEDRGAAIEKCKNLYGLGVDCEYEIISVKEVN